MFKKSSWGSAVGLEGSNALSIIACVKRILEHHWENRDDYEDLEEKHDSNGEL